MYTGRVTWGADEQMTHASDARLRGALAAGFDPWTDERRRVRSRAPGYTELLEIRPAKAGRVDGNTDPVRDAALRLHDAALRFDPWENPHRISRAGRECLSDRTMGALQNTEDCELATREGVLNPALQHWEETKIDDWISGYSLDRGPKPPAFYSYPSMSIARGGPALGRGPPRASTITPGGSGALRAMLARAERLGLLGQDRDQASPGESVIAADLRRGFRMRARETYDVGRMETSLKWFEEFQTDARREPVFVPLRHSGDIEAMTYNQETLEMFAEYLRRRGSRLRGRFGETIKSDTIATYVGQIKKLRTHEAHHAIVDASVNVVAPSAFKRMRQEDGPAGDRKLSLGLRARHLRQIAAAGFDRRSRRGAQEWGAALTAHNLLLRGGEVCVVEQKALDTARDMTIGAITFKEPSEVSKDLPWLTVDIVSIKDTDARRRNVVMPVRRRAAGGELGSGPMDTYDAIVLAIAGRIGRLPPTRGRVEGADALLPLFVGPKGEPWSTADTRRVAKKLAGKLGLEEQHFGAKSFRIGGATDYRAIYGPEAAERMVRQRGRWWSDIHALYQRALADEHLEGSAALADARGAELEALCEGWAQPANFR